MALNAGLTVAPGAEMLCAFPRLPYFLIKTRRCKERRPDGTTLEHAIGSFFERASHEMGMETM
jgi:hypothetical protein